jgi:hypothetical protein
VTHYDADESAVDEEDDNEGGFDQADDSSATVSH